MDQSWSIYLTSCRWIFFALNILTDLIFLKFSYFFSQYPPHTIRFGITHKCSAFLVWATVNYDCRLLELAQVRNAGRGLSRLRGFDKPRWTIHQLAINRKIWIMKSSFVPPLQIECEAIEFS